MNSCLSDVVEGMVGAAVATVFWEDFLVIDAWELLSYVSVIIDACEALLTTSTAGGGDGCDCRFWVAAIRDLEIESERALNDNSMVDWMFLWNSSIWRWFCSSKDC